MNTFDFNRPITAHALNESLYKQFNVKINFDKYTREELENYRNLLRTKVHQVESHANFNELLTDDTYQKDKFILGVLNTRIKEMLGEAKLAEKAVSKAQQKFMGMVHAAQKGEKPASKEVAKVAKGMSKKAAKDYAATKHKGLPAHVDEGSATVNFDGNDIKKLERIRDIDALKQKAFELITADSNHPLKPEKIAYFKRQLSKMTEPLQVISMMYQMLLSGEGNAVIGSAGSMKKNAYRDRFGEDQVTEAKKKSKPDFLDMDKDGNKKEPMKKAIKDKKIKEAAKPDYIDLDKDGNKKEPMKKAAKDAKKKPVKEARMSAAERAQHHAKEYMRHHKEGNLEMALHHREACEECGGMIQHGPMGECWHMHAGVNKGKPYKVGLEEIMTAEGRVSFKTKSSMIAESVAVYIAEDEEGKAKAITAGVDMVNDFTTWMQRVGNYQTKSMIELADNIRANFGVQEAETFKQAVGQALENALNALTQTREEINNAVSVLAGESPAQEPMGQEPRADMAGGMAPEPAEDDTLNLPTVDDEFGASDAAAGGPETSGRMKRESIERGNRLMRILGA